MKRYAGFALVLVAIVLVGGVAPAAAVAATLGFGTAANTTVGTDSAQVVAGDWDRDGDLDLAVADEGSDEVSILLNDGTGGYGTPTDVTVDDGPSGIAAGDLNGDGCLDLVTANSLDSSGDDLTILLNNGSGSFTASGTLTASGHTFSVVAGDFDRDGKLDIAATSSDGSIDVFAGFGDGTFDAVASSAITDTPRGIAKGDLDRDGDLDLVATTSGDEVVVLPGGTGTGFGTPTYETVGAAPWDVIAADFDHNGTLDLAVSNRTDNDVSVLLGDGAGGFDAHVDYAAGGNIRRLAAADLDRNGTTDLAVAVSSTNEVDVFSGDGDGTFATHVSFGVQSGPYGVMTGDVDRDGRSDLVTANYGADSVSVRLNTTYVATGWGFEPRVGYSTDPGPSSVAVGDFDRDGHFDVALSASSQGELTTRLGNGDGTLGAKSTVSVGSYPVAVIVADCNNDAMDDVVVVDYTDELVHIYPGLGDGTFGVVQSVTVGSSPYSIAAGDVDGDGSTDLAVAELGSDSFSLLRNDGSGAFSLDASYYVSPGDDPSGIAFGDFDRDGDLDAAVSCYATDDVAVMPNDGTGVFGPATMVPCQSGAGPWSLATADLDRNGIVDLATAHYNGSQVSALIGDGSGGFADGVAYDVGLGSAVPVQVVAGDFNRDGKDDVVTANSSESTATVMTGLGDGTIEFASNWPCGSTPNGLAFADLNGDDRSDLLTADFSQNSGEVGVQLADNTPPTTGDNANTSWWNIERTVTLTAGDTGSGISETKYNIDGTGWLSGDSVLVEAPLDGSGDGAHTVQYYSVDVALNIESPKSCVVNIDTTKPVIGSLSSSTHPSQSTWYPTVNPSFSWSGTDATSGIAAYSYILDQTADTTPDIISEGSGISADYAGGRSDGVYYFHIRARDNASNWGEAQHYTVRIDATLPPAPNVSSSTHESQTTWYANNDPAFSWSCTDATSGVSGYSYILDQSVITTPDTTSEGSGTTASYTDKADGTWYFHARARDNAGNWGTTQHYTVKIDTTNPPAPTVSSSTHASQSAWYANNDPALSWSCSDPSSGVAGYSYEIDQTSTTTPDTTSEGSGTTTSYTDKADGTWYFHVRALDNAGNWGTAQHFTINVDTTAPSGVSDLIGSPHAVEASWYSNNAPTMNWTAATDGGSGVAGYAMVRDTYSTTPAGTSVQQTGTSKSYSGLSNGVNYFHVRAIDNAGNAGATTHYALRIDTVAPPAPTVNSTTHLVSGTWYANNDPALNWSCTDYSPASGVADYSYILDQTADTTPDTTSEGADVSTSYTDKADGTWYFHVRARDNAGNWGTARHYTVRIDATNPSAISGLASSDHPVEATWYTDNTPSLSWSASSDATSGVVGYSFIFDQVADTVPDTASDGSGTSTSYSAQADGLYYFHVRSIDNAGNGGATSQYAVRIDATNPSAISGLASSTHPVEANWYNNNTPALSWSASSDATSGVAGYSYVLDHAAGTLPDATSEGSATSKTYSAQSDGTWYFHVSAVDNAGNVGTPRHYAVRIDTSNPESPAVSSSTHPVEATWYTGNDPALSWVPGGSDSGITGYSYVLDQTSTTTPDTTSEGSGTTASYTDKADGLWYFHVRAVNAVGSWGNTAHYGIRIDTTNPPAPTVSSSTHASQSAWYANNDPALSWSCTDPSSGVAGYSYVLDQTSTTTPDTTSEGSGTTTSYNDKADGTWYFHVRARDNVGHWGAASHYTVLIDTTAPTTSDDYNHLPWPVTTITFSATDAHSVVATTEYRIDGGAWTSGTSVTLRVAIRHRRGGLSRGLHLLEYRSTDNLGNVETPGSCTVTLGS